MEQWVQKYTWTMLSKHPYQRVLGLVPTDRNTVVNSVRLGVSLWIFLAF